ncbi:MAG TPA: hypothetical protein VMV29_21340 [Ktedonobacterales bacterium]|nr:hypothetical protein [Ktedonobacterales bacterium]
MTGAGVIIILLLASLIFLSAILIGLALMIRTRWDPMASGRQPGQQPERRR